MWKDELETVDGYRLDATSKWMTGYALRVVGDGRVLQDHEFYYANGRMVIYRRQPRRLTVIMGNKATHWVSDPGIVLREICDGR